MPSIAPWIAPGSWCSNANDVLSVLRSDWLRGVSPPRLTPALPASYRHTRGTPASDRDATFPQQAHT